jgi:hypothetical protein
LNNSLSKTSHHSIVSEKKMRCKKTGQSRVIFS